MTHRGTKTSGNDQKPFQERERRTRNASTDPTPTTNPDPELDPGSAGSPVRRWSRIRARIPPESEACADPPADEVSSSLVTLDDDTTRQDHLALFDVYWNDSTDEDDPNSQTLVTNPCPPLVVHHPAQYDERGDLDTPARTTRGPSDVNIGHTIIHIPSSELQQAAEGDTPAVVSFKRRVTASGTGDYDGTKYDFLRPKLANGTRAASADVWVVPACHEEEEAGTPTPTDLDPPSAWAFPPAS